MAEIVAAMAASHAPLITAAPETAPEDRRARVYAAMEELRAEIERAHPTAIVIASNEHFSNFFLDNFPPACIGIGATHTGPVEAWLKVERGEVVGQPSLGRSILEQSFEDGLDLTFSEELFLDHGVMTILHFLDPGHAIPVVPIIQNCGVKPMPRLRRCYELGRTIGRAVHRWDAAERVALVGAGGLSHWVGVPHMGHINEAWDRRVLDLLAAGDAEAVMRMSDDEIEAAGNGAHEIRSWLVVAGAMEGRPARVVGYEPIHAWATGMGQLTYDVSDGV
ncbi:MAG: hypothetical protein HYX52_01480 [Chloroflexi bacterium]|nr:hypothetical protein [Chloroflexota bacterium]